MRECTERREKVPHFLGVYQRLKLKGRAVKGRRVAMKAADSCVIEQRLARLERGVKRGKRANTAMMGPAGAARPLFQRLFPTVRNVRKDNCSIPQ
jgi:hypothetical protein